MNDLLTLGISQIICGAALFSYAVYTQRHYKNGGPHFIAGCVTAMWGTVAALLGLIA